MPDNSSICVYCGQRQANTVDHIPPMCLFPQPRPPEIRKIPSCSKCNGGASKDDEYFKYWLTLRHDISQHTQGSKLLKSVYRGLAMSAKRGMLQALVRSLNRIPLYTPSGIYLGDATAYDVDLNRLGNVTNRIVKGLFFTEFHHRLPDTYGVRSFSESGIKFFSSDQRKLMVQMARSVSGGPKQTIGMAIFEYWCSPSLDDTNTTAWLLRFFESETFLCITADSTKARPAT
jgi:hypothetical protein